MARQTVASEFNSFVGGLITEASPLTFPGNAALDINNFNIDKRGTLSRRLGVDFEPNHEVIAGGSWSGEAPTNTFNWDNAGGIPDSKIVVVRTGYKLDFFSTNGDSITSGLLYTYTFPVSEAEGVLDSAVVDGLLVVVGEDIDPIVFSYNGLTIEEQSYRLKIRDSFGIEDVIDGVDYREGNNVGLRPDDNPRGTLNLSTHIYNLRNSTWGQPKLTKGGDPSVKSDPLTVFSEAATEVGLAERMLLPGLSDSPVQFLYPDLDDPTDKVSDRFHPLPCINSPVRREAAPSGFFIIDALWRGTGRSEAITEMGDEYDGFNQKFPISGIPLDRTPSGNKAVAEFAGRVWYAGFSGAIRGGDAYSPRMSSYVLFSSLIETASDLGKCHQIGDPTSVEESQLVATDGGFIKLDEAYGIQKMINIGTGLVVLAENGVWFISGGADIGFTATDYKINKITQHGCTAPGSVTLVDNSVIYWGDDGIYQININEQGNLQATNISTNTIQALFDGVSELDKRYVRGRFDSYDRKIRWLYENRLSEVGPVSELILDVELGAYYIHTIPHVGEGSPKVVDYVEVPPFKVELVGEDVTDEELVVDGGVQVVTQFLRPVNKTRELLYLTALQPTPAVSYTMSKYYDRDFIDWKTFDGVGVDAPARLITGYNGGGDFQRYKQVPYVTFHLQKTEDGFYTDGEGDIYPLHESSCKVQAQWEWANSSESGRWGKQFQAYRHKRAYIPQNDEDNYNNGFSVVTTKNKLRGKGRVLSLQITTEPLKDCKLLGWSMLTSVGENV